MRITIPAGAINVLRHNVTMGVKLVERKLNQNPTYMVTYQGTALHFGRSRRHMQRAFNRYTLRSDEVRTLGA